MKDKFKGLTGACIKNICAAAMLFDHIAASLILRWEAEGGNLQAAFLSMPGSADSVITYAQLYRILKTIGRIVYPTFIFFMVEGFYYTKSKGKYASRLFLFALISELPFDWAFITRPRITESGITGLAPEFMHQNIFFSLLIGFLLMWAMDEMRKLIYKRVSKKGIAWSVLRVAACAAVYVGLILAAAVLASRLNTDYGSMGVLATAAMFIVYLPFGSDSRLRKWQRIAAFVLGFTVLTAASEIGVMVVATLMMILYNGQRGRQNKYFFYVYYPAHIFVLAIIGTVLSYCVWWR